jgi:transposase
MAAATEDFASWVAQAEIPQSRLTPEVEAVLRAVYHFRQEQGGDFYSTRLLSHFLLHCHSGLKVAQVARLVGISRPTASEQQGLSSKQVVQQAHHRLKGRPYGKLLPRFAGPIAGFLHAHPDASRADLLGFIHRTFGVKVSRVALYKFLKKYGLGQPVQPQWTQPAADSPAPSPAPAQDPPPGPKPVSPLPAQSPREPGPALAPPPPPAGHAPQILLPGPSLTAVLAPEPPFSSGGPSMPGPSC